MPYFLLFVALALNAAANLLLKAGAVRLGPWSEPGIVSRLATNYYLMAGLLLFALNAAFYVGALTRLNLSVAYPVMVAGGIAIIGSISVLFLGETLATSQIIGLVLLTAGTILVLHHLPA
jgi:multidrug transporter EmrE-like cation transporter